MSNVSNKKAFFSTRDLVVIAAFAAIASILFAIDFSLFPAVPFYKLDFSNIPVIIVTFALGPVQGIVTALLKDVIGLLHSTSGGVGELADFLATLAYIIPAGLIYHRRKTLRNAIIGMAAGTVLAIIISMLANNYILFPFYGIGEAALVGMGSKMFPAVNSRFSFLLLITGLFNLIKFVIISVVTGFIYKPLSPILHGKKRTERKEPKEV